MARVNKPTSVVTTTVSSEAPAPEVTAAEVTTKPVKLRAVHNRMRNPVTGAMYRTDGSTDVVDLFAPECHFERSQLKAKLLEIVG